VPRKSGSESNRYGCVGSNFEIGILVSACNPYKMNKTYFSQKDDKRNYIRFFFEIRKRKIRICSAKVLWTATRLDPLPEIRYAEGHLFIVRDVDRTFPTGGTDGKDDVDGAISIYQIKDTKFPSVFELTPSKIKRTHVGKRDRPGAFRETALPSQLEPVALLIQPYLVCEPRRVVRIDTGQKDI
jgi:hypothetical protein